MIDLHCHLLPGIDDGPATLADALAMARAAVAAGITTIAATPHVDHHFRLDPTGFAARAAELREALAFDGIELEVVAGGEVAPARLPDLEDGALEAVALGGGPYVLLECPLTQSAPTMGPAVAYLTRRGRKVLLAHPERSPGLQRDLSALAAMVQDGALTQVTAGALAGDHGSTARRTAIQMLRAGLVHCIASDAHDTDRRPPDLLRGIRAAEADVPGLADRTAWMTEEVPAAILEGRAPAAPPPLGPDRPGLLARLRRA